MTEDQMKETQQADAFEAALAANATEISTPVVEEEIVEAPVASTEPELALASDEDGDIESDENDPNAEFRRTLRTALGDWYVVHSYAGYEKKVRDNLNNRKVSLHMEDFIFQIEVPEEEVMEIAQEIKQYEKGIHYTTEQLEFACREVIKHISGKEKDEIFNGFTNSQIMSIAETVYALIKLKKIQ